MNFNKCHGFSRGYLLGDVNDLKKTLKKISLNESDLKEVIVPTSKSQEVSFKKEEEEEKNIEPESQEFEMRNAWGDKVKKDILSALKSSEPVDREWALAELEFYAKQGNK